MTSDQPDRPYTNISSVSILSILKQLEWPFYDICIICSELKPNHLPSCDLAFHIAKLTETTPTDTQGYLEKLKNLEKQGKDQSEK